MKCPKCKSNRMHDYWDYLEHRFKCFICGCTTGLKWQPDSLRKQVQAPNEYQP